MYWNIAMSIHLHIVRGDFPTTITEFSATKIVRLTEPKIFTICPSWKKFANPALKFIPFMEMSF